MRVWQSKEMSAHVLAAAKRGEHTAFIAILRHHDRRLRTIAYRILRDRQLMDDALQDVALKAYRALPAFRGDASVGTWLCQIAYTTCLDYLRRTPEVELVPFDELAELLPGDAGVSGAGVAPVATVAPADTAELVAQHDLLERALSRLPAEQRIAVLLVDQAGLDYRSVAQILGIPAGTVGSRLNAAHAALRRSNALRRQERLPGSSYSSMATRLRRRAST